MTGRVGSSVAVLGALALAGCDGGRLATDDPVWTLYVAERGGSRGHMATFDAETLADGFEGNAGRCEAARDALAARKDGRRYWCELGRFRKDSASRPASGAEIPAVANGDTSP